MFNSDGSEKKEHVRDESTKTLIRCIRQMDIGEERKKENKRETSEEEQRKNEKKRRKNDG